MQQISELINMQSKLTELKEEIDSNITPVGDFNTYFQ